jgi:hypothetical protein
VNTVVSWVTNSSDSSSKDDGTIDESGISVWNDSSEEVDLVNKYTISISVSVVQSGSIFSVKLLTKRIKSLIDTRGSEIDIIV